MRLVARKTCHGVVLTWDLVREMAASGLVEFHSHTLDHPKCGELAADELRNQLLQSRQVIEERLGRPCPFLCWPYGNVSEAAVAQARAAGYTGLFTTRLGVARKGADPLAIRRVVVKDKVTWFKSRVLMYTNPVAAACYLAMKR